MLTHETVFPFAIVPTEPFVGHAAPTLAVAALDAGVAASSEPRIKTANSAACDFLARVDVEKFIRTLL